MRTEIVKASMLALVLVVPVVGITTVIIATVRMLGLDPARTHRASCESRIVNRTAASSESKNLFAASTRDDF